MGLQSFCIWQQMSPKPYWAGCRASWAQACQTKLHATAVFEV